MKRRKAREYALQFLYRIDFLEEKAREGVMVGGEISAFWTDMGEGNPDVRRFAEDLIRGAFQNIQEIDDTLQVVAEKWSLQRMAHIDRNILRLAAYELLYRKDIPTAVTINEAIEIARKYSTLESAAFINGMLDKIAKTCAKKV
ncbi:MAG: transcription antitermination factor NusB, partial [Nitrospirales bacterium]|nr:transcription antitermination factor NusB [Nitrospirales bacterium]